MIAFMSHPIFDRGLSQCIKDVFTECCDWLSNSVPKLPATNFDANAVLAWKSKLEPEAGKATDSGASAAD